MFYQAGARGRQVRHSPGVHNLKAPKKTKNKKTKYSNQDQYLKAIFFILITKSFSISLYGSQGLCLTHFILDLALALLYKKNIRK